MGEISLNCGQIYVSGKLSYASQKPWIFSSSMKDNILFGQAYDEARYWQTIRACALDHEFSQLRTGDETMISEESPNMTRALKSKISLAR